MKYVNSDNLTVTSYTKLDFWKIMYKNLIDLGKIVIRTKSLIINASTTGYYFPTKDYIDSTLWILHTM